MLERRKKHPKQSNTKTSFLPPSPFKILCVCVFFCISKRKTARTQRISGLKAPKRRWIQAWDSWVKSLCLVSFRPWKCFARFEHFRFRPSDSKVGDKFGESLGGSQAPPSFWEVPGLPRKFPELPRKFFGDFPGSSLTVELNSNPEVPRKFPKLPRKFPKLPRKFPDFPGGQPLSLGSLTPSPDSQVSERVFEKPLKTSENL